MKRSLFLGLIVLLLAGCNLKKSDEVVRTTNYTYEEYYPLMDGRVDSLHIAIAVEFPEKVPNDDLLEPIQQNIKSEIFGDAYQYMDIKQAIEAFTAMLKTEYRQNNLPVAEERRAENDPALDAILNEEQIISSMVMDVHNYILSYAVERYVFMGGAHGSNYRIFYNYDLNTGEQLHEEDIFVEGYEEPLTELLLSNMVAQNEDVELIDDLKRYGYNVDEILPNDNFFLTDSSLVYVFNPYDIAPYSLGETEISIAYDQLQDLLQTPERF